MPHYTIFCKNEIKKIKKLLDDMIDKPKSEQLRIRNILRDTYGFYISDFSPVRPYTSDVLELDIANGKITIDRFEPEFGALKGWPKDICSKINISVGQYLRRFNNVKVGITNNPSRRFREHINRNP